MLLKSQLRWAGNVSRMEDHRLPKITMYGELSTGHRDRGAPKKRYKDCLKKSLSACHIDHRQWSTLAADRTPSTGRFPPPRTPLGPPSRKNVKGGRTVQLRHQTPTRSSPAATATGPADPASALSVTSVPAVDDVDHHLHDLRSRSQAIMMKSIAPKRSIKRCQIRTCIIQWHLSTATIGVEIAEVLGTGET